MDDIVERLRLTREWVAFPFVPICVEAADEIERLRAKLKEAEQRLKYAEAVIVILGDIQTEAEERLKLLNQCRKHDHQDNIDRQHKEPSVK